MIKKVHTWSQLKELVIAKKSKSLLRYKKSGKRYEVTYGYNDTDMIIAIFNSTSRDGIDFETNFLPFIVEEKRVDPDGNIPVTIQPSTGSAVNFYSPNLCDPCSWYTDSIEVLNESLTTSDQLLWNSSSVNFIDMTHGRLYKEDDLLASFSLTLPNLVPKVEVFDGTTWILKSEDVWGAASGDYSISYENGTILFNTPIPLNYQVRASYHKADAMVFYITPGIGKTLKIIYAEIQHTSPLEFNQSIIFQSQVYNPYALPSRVDYGPPVTYKTIRDFEQEARGSYSTKEPRGGLWVLQEVTGIQNIQNELNIGSEQISSFHNGVNWVSLMKKMTGERGFKSKQYVVPLPYNAYRPIPSDVGARVKITLSSPTNQSFGGEFANVTFYCISETD